MSVSEVSAALARVLITHGALVTESDSELGTPLHAAATNDKAALAEVLLEPGAEVDARGPLDSTPLCLAASTGSVRVLQVLLAHGADVNAVNGRPLRWATRNGEIESVKVLLAHGARLDPRDVEEGTAIRDRDTRSLHRIAPATRVSARPARSARLC